MNASRANSLEPKCSLVTYIYYSLGRAARPEVPNGVPSATSASPWNTRTMFEIKHLPIGSRKRGCLFCLTRPPFCPLTWLELLLGEVRR